MSNKSGNESIQQSGKKSKETSSHVDLEGPVKGMDDDHVQKSGEKNKIESYVDLDEPVNGIDEETGKKMYNNWSKKNVDTLRDWKNSLLKSGVIYTFVLEKYKNYQNHGMIVSMIFGYISTLLAAISTALLAVSKDYIWTIFGITISVLVMNGIVAVTNTILKIKDWSTMVTEYTRYLDKIDDFYAVTSNLLMLPADIRMDAIEFIKKYNNVFLKLHMNNPMLYPKDYSIAYKKYIDYIENNEKYSVLEQKYGRNDDLISII